MEIQDLGLDLSTNLSSHKWALVQVSRARRKDVTQRVEDVRTQLSQLLYGLNLDVSQIYQYRVELLKALELADSMEGEHPLPDLKRTPAEQRLYRVGGVIWTPGSKPKESFTPSAEHQIHSHKLLETHRKLGALGETGVRRAIHTVGIVLAHNLEGTRAGEDVVEMTDHGVHVLTDPSQVGQVATLRLPPRFPREVEMLALSKAA